MGLITLTAPAAGQGVNSGPIATAFSVLQTVINGNIDAANIADGSITPVKLSAPSTLPATLYARSDASASTPSNHTTYQDAGGSITIPVGGAGDYIVDFGGVVEAPSSVTGYLSVKKNAATAAQDADAISETSAVGPQYMRRIRLNSLAEGDVMKLQHKSDDAGNAVTSKFRWLEARKVVV